MACSLFAAEPFAGNWNLIPAKSTGVIPKAEVVAIEEQGDQLRIRITIERSDATGPPMTIRYTAPKQGGQGHIDEGPYNGVATKRIGNDTLEITYLTDGKANRSTRAVISNHGKTMTSRGDGVSPQGTPASWVMVFEKSP